MTAPDFEKAILLSCGTEASERAIKIARINGTKVAQDKNILVAGMSNYHGKTMGAQMLSGQDSDKEWIGYHDPNIVHMPFPYPWVLEEFSGNGEELFYCVESLEIHSFHLILIVHDSIFFGGSFG